MISELPYCAEGAALFTHIAQRPWAVYLDSGRPGSGYGRYDILTADPFITLTTQGNSTTINRHGVFAESAEPPFSLLQQIVGEFPVSQQGLPFVGGAIGYFAYDLARRLERLPQLALDAEHLPEMAVAIYDWAVVIDHQAKRAWLVGQGFDQATRQRWNALQAMFSRPAPQPALDFSITGPLLSNMTQQSYAQAFQRVLAYIQAGDCYQVNLAQRFSAPAQGDGWSAYRRLRHISPAPFSAFCNFPQAQILSASPERFVRVENGRVATMPIKGTRPRGADPLQDAANARELCASLKDRAENLMIVDLLRNDIGKNCAVGSVKAEHLFALESYANVHHLVSTVTGELAPGKRALDLLQGCFPGGSITGAPKLRAMQIIEELEPHRRGVYCGAIGYIGFDGNMDTSIAIRTAVYSSQMLRFWAGGGIVADSEMEKEYRETWDKASSMLQLVERFDAHR